MLIPAVILLFLGFYHETKKLQNVYRDRIKQELITSTALLAPVVDMYIKSNNLSGLAEYCQKTFDPATELNSRVTIFDSDGKVLLDTWNEASEMENHRNRPEFQYEKIHGKTGELKTYYTYQRYSTTTKRIMLYCITGLNVEGRKTYLRTAISVHDVKTMTERLRDNYYSLLGLTGLMALIVGCGGFYCFYRPTKQLRQAARHIAEGDFQIPLPVPRSGPLREISFALGSVSERLQRQMLQFSAEKGIRDVIFSTMTDGVILLNGSGTIVDINSAAARTLDISSNHARGKRLRDVWRTFPDDVETILQTASNQDSGETDLETVERGTAKFDRLSDKFDEMLYSEELEFDLPTGRRKIHLQIQKVQRPYLEEKTGFLFVFHDLTALRKLESYRRDFVANVSHEIKTPLTVIMGAVEALEEGAANDPDMAKTFLETLSQHARRLQALLEDVLSLSRLECQTRKEDLPFETAPIVEPVELAVSLCQPQAQERGTKLIIDDRTVEYNAEVEKGDKQQSFLEIQMVEPMIEQALVNLISNAIKYSNAGDEIIVRIERSIQDANRLQIHVIDHGPGLTAEHLERVFERFYRVDASRSQATGGTGLGLAIVKHIVQLHGGTVHVESRPGHGCDFIVELKAPI